MNRNIYVNGIWQVRVTPENYLTLLETNKKQTQYVECIYESYV